MLDFLANPEVWGALVTLTFLEIVLGVDNIIFISIAANKVKPEEQAKARNIGLILAMIFRLILLFFISFLIQMQKPLFSVDWSFAKGGFSGQALILLAGGIFLIYKSTKEIHHKLEGEEAEKANGKAKSTLTQAIVQIALINVVFSFDSILTAVGMTNGLEGAMPVMIISVILSMIIMMVFAGPVGRFVNEHPSIQMLGLSFLILIGFMLITESAHMANLELFGAHVGVIPKGYLYFAISFSLFVEFLNLRMRKKK
ncbi:MAG: TerC family protein [Flavobacteriales bacterium]|jgi:predicted tellurium resistance membrane protein TerC|nr:TerC family protein [Flavobacteriales bacterium]